MHQATLDEANRRKEMIAELSRAKENNTDSCNHFLVTLNGLQQVIRKLCNDATAERNKVRAISVQHLKLRNILFELTGKNMKSDSINVDSEDMDTDSLSGKGDGDANQKVKLLLVVCAHMYSFDILTIKCRFQPWVPVVL
jgi:hypothetical protein